MKNHEMDKKNQRLKQQSEEAQKSKADTMDPFRKKFNQPNRPSI